jgi:hypothetical protein
MVGTTFSCGLLPVTIEGLYGHRTEPAVWRLALQADVLDADVTRRFDSSMMSSKPGAPEKTSESLRDVGASHLGRLVLIRRAHQNV